MIILDGKKHSFEIEKRLKDELNKMKKKLRLSVILVGNNAASLLYVDMKKKKCQKLGIDCEIIKIEKNISEKYLLNRVKNLNDDKNITGILVQLPLPNHINTRKILDSVDIDKDVDGLSSINLTNILLNKEGILPCTPKGIIILLKKYNISLEGKNVCVIGFSDVVGKPLATMCLNRSATVTVCHIKTKNLKEHTLSADIIMTATGVPKLIKEEMVSEGAVVIDIGISKLNGKIVGDVDYNKVKNKCSYITPVPGGVGPMTIISLIDNLITLYKNR